MKFIFKWLLRLFILAVVLIVIFFLSLNSILRVVVEHNIRTQTGMYAEIGSFKLGSSSLSVALKSQIHRIAVTIRIRKYRKVDLFGYTAATGLSSLNVSLSRARARNVATYLRSQLTLLKMHGVTVLSAGEGAIKGQTNNSYSRVEVFGV